MGGTSNLIYACLHPEDVSGVVALCPATDLATYYSWCRGRNTGVLKEIADAVEKAYGGDAVKQPESYTTHSCLKNASKLKMPVYVAHGTADDIIPVSQSRRLTGIMGDSKSFAYIEIPDGGHDSPLSMCGSGFDWVMNRSDK
jgi:pimeloyl-ACP methyl ester carboxylesterase